MGRVERRSWNVLVGRPGGWAAQGRAEEGTEEAKKKAPKSEPGGRKGLPKVMKRGSGEPLGTVRKVGPDKWPKKSASAEEGEVPERYGVPAKVVKKRSEKRHRKKGAPGSLSDHFGEPFGSLFGPKSGPEAGPARFFGEKGHCEQTLLFTMIWVDLGGPGRSKTRLGGAPWEGKAERKTEREKRVPKAAFGAAFGAAWGGQNGLKRLKKRL